MALTLGASLPRCLPERDCASTATCPPDPDAALATLDDAAADVLARASIIGDVANDELERFTSANAARPAGAASSRAPASASSSPRDCPAPLLACAESCVDARSDVSNCGGCGVKCPSIGNTIAVCQEGACTTQCVGGGATLCGSTCVDLQADVNNCSACGARCVPPSGGTVVCEGACKARCGPDARLCGGACVARDDVNHCGACANVCAPPEPVGSGAVSCSSGACAQTCNDGRLLCRGTCCALPKPNEQATCEGNPCATACLFPPLLCADGARPCGGWNFDSRTPEGWAVYPYQASAWDRAPLLSVEWAGGRALAAGFDGNGATKWLLSLEVPLCGSEVVDLSGKVVHARVGLRSAEGYALNGEATAELWTAERVAAPTELAEGRSVALVGSAMGPATTVSIDFKITEPWRGLVIIDDVYVQ